MTSQTYRNESFASTMNDNNKTLGPGEGDNTGSVELTFACALILSFVSSF